MTNQDRIKLEAEAVLAILSGCEKGKWYLLSSEVIDFEIIITPDNEKREKVLAFTNLAHERIELNEGIKNRAEKLVNMGFKNFDALHLAWLRVCLQKFF